MSKRIDVTGINMIEFVQQVYSLSRPQGMGIMHFKLGELSEEDAKLFIRDDGTVSMDYVKGRACKMHVRKEGDTLTISDSWYDHTDLQFTELLTHFGLAKPNADEHHFCCNCQDCQPS